MSSAHLLLISIGPVQDFIFEARRTRDLWFGSHALSELSRAGARALVAAGGLLAFPAMAPGDPELEPCPAPTRDGQTPPIMVANKLLAEIPAGVDVAAVARAIRAAITEHWLAIAARARRPDRGGPLLSTTADAAWAEQVETLLEFQAVWLPLPDNAYNATRIAVERALAARKNLRDFPAWVAPPRPVPKSSLDGARETVLRERRQPQAPFARFRIGPGEQLDAIGVIKRTGFEPDQFMPIVNVAVAAWLDRAQAAAPAELDALRAACANIVPRVVVPSRAGRLFGFDASVLFEPRLPALFEEIGGGAPPDAIMRAARALRAAMRQHRHAGPPSYVACLVADGDHMGEAIGRLADRRANFAFSRALGAFPARARQTVDEHCGALIFAGGDDVLALLPVETAVACAAQLHRDFNAALAGAVPAPTPTLSVGIAIAHAIEPMRALLALGREAERRAKDPDRDALALILDKRSGGQRALRIKWNNEPVARLAALAELLERRLSGSKVYALDALLRRLPTTVPDADAPDWTQALRSYAEDVLQHVGDGAEPASLADFGVAAGPSYDGLRGEIAAAINRTLIVRGMTSERFL